MTERGDDKQTIASLKARVRLILLHDWDPIGIQDVPQAKDEYDRYADEISSRPVTGHATIAEIADYLFVIATEHMGLGVQPQSEAHCRDVARLISLGTDPSRNEHRNGSRS